MDHSGKTRSWESQTVNDVQRAARLPVKKGEHDHAFCERQFWGTKKQCDPALTTHMVRQWCILGVLLRFKDIKGHYIEFCISL